MKKNYFLLFYLLLGFNFLSAQNVSIPDAVFKQYLVSNFDTSGDGEIQSSEAKNVTSIAFENKIVGTLEGIRSFTNLQTLYCPNNNIITLDLQGLSFLKTINCSSNNNMQVLNVQGLSSLESLRCNNNRLPALNVQGLTKLKNLYCQFNNLKSLDVSGLTDLKILDCNYNFLTELKFAGAIQITDLNCSTNDFTSLDFRGLDNLIYLSCDENELTSLNVDGLTKLINFSCTRNQLKTLNVKSLKNVLNIECSYNQLTTLDVSGLSKLGAILCYNNKLTSIIFQGEYPTLNNLFCYNNEFITLDLRNLPSLQQLEVNNNPNLTSLFIKNGMDQTGFLKLGNNNLKYVCCDESEYNYVQNLIDELGFQNQCSVNTYCSFIPGGDYNTIDGISRYNKDNTGCNTNNDGIFIKYNINNSNENGLIFGNSDGNYKTYVNTGTFTLTPVFENPDYFTASPASKEFVFANGNHNTQSQDFCIISNGIKNDLEVKIIPVNTVRPGFTTTFRLIYKNKGNTVLSGDVNFVFDHLKSEFISSDVSPNSVTAGNLNWNFTNIKPFESKTIIITLKTFAPPIVNVNEKLTYNSKINPIAGDLTEYDNNFSLVQTVVGSFDPNDKVCLEGEFITPGLIGKYVTYKIRFENTGTANAEQVVVKDIINTAMFDVNSIIPIVASHSYKTRITGNTVEFIFENIDLPFDDANNDGYIAFKIKTLPNLTVGSQIKNKADIFFDYNLPITTNEFSSLFQTLATNDLELPKTDLKIYPNPVKDFINIETKEKADSIEIFDINGRILSKSSVDKNKINVETFKSGIYIIKINTKSGYYLKKIIKE